MGVTAELGRRRMTVRDLLALTPGLGHRARPRRRRPGRRARERHADRARRGRRDRRGVRHPHRGDRRRGADGRGLMSTAATLALFARLLVSLGVVIGLMWLAARVVRRRGIGGVGGAEPAAGRARSTSIARRTLGRNASIAVVRAGNQANGRRRHRSAGDEAGRRRSRARSISRTRRANGRPLRKGRTARLRHGRRCSSSCGTVPPDAERHRAAGPP